MSSSDHNNDRIILQNMRFSGKHGVTEEERSRAQGFGVDVEIVRNLQIAGHSDNLESTVDYSQVHDIARQVIEGEPYKLLEAIAEQISRRLFEGFAFEEAIIRVWKNQPPLGGQVDYAGVQIHRFRPADNRVYLSLGSNVGDREENIYRALALIDDATPKVHVTQVSPIYETEPVGNPNQGWFLNCCAEVQTELSPVVFHELTRAIEGEMNIEPKIKWQPRVIDVDILLYGGRTINNGDLTIPHEFMAERAFVLQPLADIASDAKHPNGSTIGELMSALTEHEEVRLFKY